MSRARVQPGASPALTLTVPNEGTSPVNRFEVDLPAGATAGPPEAKAGWWAGVSGRKVTWRGGAIPPGEFTTFALRIVVPSRPTTIVLLTREFFGAAQGPTFRLPLVVAPVAHRAAAAGRDTGARTLGKFALGVALAAIVIGAGAGFLALWVWLRGPT